MGKKQMSIYLDEEAVTVVRDFLEKSGQSFSGWVNAFVSEMAQDIKGQPSPLNKPVGQMSMNSRRSLPTGGKRPKKELLRIRRLSPPVLKLGSGLVFTPFHQPIPNKKPLISGATLPGGDTGPGF